MDQYFSKTKELADGIEGMLSPFSMAAMDSLLSLQNSRHISGDMVELGVFRGKSAAILARRLAFAERLHLYDIADYFDRSALEKTAAKLSYNIGSTLDLSKGHFQDKKRGVRFCHIDASHQFEPTIHEMTLADYVLSDDGILCLDDYTNLNYSQILAATFKYLFTKKTDLTMFMVTDEKAYLCRKAMFPVYAGFVLNSIIDHMSDRGIDNACIARTDDCPSYGAFYLRTKQDGETDDRYGAELYRGFYQIRDHSTPKARATRFARPLIRALRALKARVFPIRCLTSVR